MQREKLARLVLLIFLVLLIAGCSSQEDKKENYFKSALSYIEEGKQTEAILELKNAIQIDPKYAEARYQLGLLYLKEQQPREAFQELVRVTDLDPENLDAYLKVAQMYFLSQELDKSREKIDHVLSKDPAHHDGLLLLVNVLMKKGEYDEALTTLEKLGDEVETTDTLQLLKAQIYTSQKNLEQAEKALKKAISIKADNFINYSALLKFYDLAGENEKRDALLGDMLEKFPDNVQTHYLAALLKNKSGDKDGAIEEMRKAVELAPHDTVYWIMLAEFQYQSGKLEEGEKTLLKAREVNADPDIVVFLTSRYFDEKNFDKAKPLFDELKTKHPENKGVKLLDARFLLKEREVTGSQTILDGLIREYPRWAEPYYYLGLIYYNSGELEKAENAMASAVQYNPEADKYHTMMAQIFYARKVYASAQKEAAAALQINRRNPRAAIILGKSLVGAKKFEDAVKILEDLDRQLPGNEEIIGNLAQAYLGIGERQKAEEKLNEILEKNPAHTRAILYLIALNHKDDLPGAEQFVRSQIEKAADQPQLYLLLASILERQKKDEEALGAYEKVLALEPENVTAFMSMAKIYIRLGKTDEALAGYKGMIEKNPSSIPARMGAATMYHGAGNIKMAREQYEKILELRKGYAPAANNLAWIIANEPEPDLGQALMLAMAAKQESPESPQIADTLGWIHYKRNSFSLAIAQFEQALENDPDNPEIIFHLALALKGAGRNEEAIKFLKPVVENRVEFSGSKEAAALLQELTSAQ
jgi:tetratricopeptide (TPR) repeat protein